MRQVMNSKLVVAALAGVAFSVHAADAPLKTDTQKLSYTVGVQIGQSLKRDAKEFDIDVVTRAIKDVLGDKKLQLSQEDMQKSMESFQQKQQQKQASAGDKNDKIGAEYLAANKKKEGVVETASGLQYKVINPGSGDKAKATDSVVVHYKGTLINGTEFDSSYKRNEPASFKVNQVIQGWQEALQLMSPGAKYQLAIPGKLAYGPRGAGGQIGPNETLLFDVELLEIKK
ncbi:MAG: FKBP-type peptidyl-prolyl cis-trans isomerase [Gammaproteobacteria bacterium]|nr:FKBP-type peptidyl-prolyl cis-trans isomerase [Gammaproteobacteria bacterium]